MAEITAALVKELREMTGAGMMECKKALVEAEGELEKAVDVLRTRGLAAVAKKAGRATDEGTVLALVSECGHDGALVELNCETDFVGMNEKFRAYAEKIAKAVLANKPADLEALKASEIEGETVEAVVTDAIHTLAKTSSSPALLLPSSLKALLLPTFMAVARSAFWLSSSWATLPSQPTTTSRSMVATLLCRLLLQAPYPQLANR